MATLAKLRSKMSETNKTQAAKAFLKNAWTATKSVALNRSRIELAVEDATNLDPWGPTGKQMQEIAEACFDAEKFRQAWGVMTKRFELEPSQWRRIYKALLLTEHLLKNSSQHVVQTILDNVGMLEGLKQFKYLDEKNKDHGINVSNRAKELTLLLADPDRIRAERTRAKALREKFKGASREDMVAAAATSGGSSSAQYSIMAQGIDRGGTGSSSTSGSPRPGRRSLPADDGAHFRDKAEEEELDGEACPTSAIRQTGAKGYGELADSANPVAATAQRIDSLRQSGLLDKLAASSSPGAGASTGAAAGTSAAALPRPSSMTALPGMPTSSSYDDLSVARSGGSQTSSAKPSLHELMARKSVPKKLQEVKVNPTIAAALGSIKLVPPAASPVSKLAPPVALLQPPAPAPQSSSQMAQTSSASTATSGGAITSPSIHETASSAAAPAASVPFTTAGALADLFATPASPATSSRVGHSSGSSSPWGSFSPTHSGMQPSTAFGAFSGASASPSGGSFTGDSFGALAKPGGTSGGAINLVVTSGRGSSSPQALPAHLFAEPAPTAYGSMGAWGTHVAGVVSKQTTTAVGNPFGSVAAAKPTSPPADDLFKDFSPFK